MCVVSMVGDHFRDKWKQPQWDDLFKKFQQPYQQNPGFISSGPTKEEFEGLKKEVAEMKKLLERALEYDKRNNEPHCEMEDKVKLLKEVAKLVGVDLNDVFPQLPASISFNPGITTSNTANVNYDEQGNMYLNGVKVNFEYTPSNGIIEVKTKTKWQERLEQMQEAQKEVAKRTSKMPNSGSHV